VPDGNFNAAGANRFIIPFCSVSGFSLSNLLGDSMRLRPISVFFLTVLLVAASPANQLSAQTTTSGGLTGVVTDPSHAVVPAAIIEIKNDAKGSIQSTKTDREGVYRFFFLAPQRYTLTVTDVGFREEKRTINILLGPPVSVNVTLAIGEASALITVGDEAPLLQAENGDISTTMNQKQVSEVPNPGNDLTYIAQTAPGAIHSRGREHRGSTSGPQSIVPRFLAGVAVREPTVLLAKPLTRNLKRLNSTIANRWSSGGYP
jgi:hypothetical protein